MGISAGELCPMGGTRYRGRASSKEGDTCSKPSSRKKETNWPTIVLKSGLSEPLRRLKCDARWWLENSEGEVKIIVIISIEPADKRLQIEKWELAPPYGNRTVTRSCPSLVLTRI
jgi:hypothetical protein